MTLPIDTEPVRIMAGDQDVTTAARFRNQSGATVRVIEFPRAQDTDSTVEHAAQCTGCLDTSGLDMRYGALIRRTLPQAREWAVQHSASCRALPQPGSDPSEDYLKSAGELVERALSITTTHDGMPRQMTADELSKTNTLTLLAAALVKLAQAHRHQPNADA